MVRQANMSVSATAYFVYILCAALAGSALGGAGREESFGSALTNHGHIFATTTATSSLTSLGIGCPSSTTKIPSSPISDEDIINDANTTQRYAFCCPDSSQLSDLTFFNVTYGDGGYSGTQIGYVGGIYGTCTDGTSLPFISEIGILDIEGETTYVNASAALQEKCTDTPPTNAPTPITITYPSTGGSQLYYSANSYQVMTIGDWIQPSNSTICPYSTVFIGFSARGTCDGIDLFQMVCADPTDSRTTTFQVTAPVPVVSSSTASNSNG